MAIMDMFNKSIAEVITVLPPVKIAHLELEIRIPVLYDVIHPEKVSIREHEHPFYEIAWMLAGEMTYLVDSRRVTNTAENRQAFFLPSRKLHKRFSDSGFSSIRSLEVALTPTGLTGSRFIERLDTALEENGFKLALLPEHLKRIERIESEAAKNHPLSRTIIGHEIILLVLDFIQSVIPDERNEEHGEAADRISGSRKDIVEYIRMRVEDLTNRSFELDALTYDLHLSGRHLNRIFYREHQMSITRYAALRRLAHAERLLSDPANTVGDVANALGFSSSSYFIAFFRKHKGMTPFQYRESLEQ